MYPFKPRTGRRRSRSKAPFPRRRRGERWSVSHTLLTIGGLSVGALIGLYWSGMGALPSLSEAASTPSADEGDRFSCSNPVVVDGDTLRCGSERVRLHGIDAPEKPGSCRPGRDCVEGDPFASTENLRELAERGELSCTRMDVDRYGRTVARCEADGVDLSCAQIEDGHAVRRYGFISCG
jgi:endonuclease YncB( thermonuclease family)